MKIKLSMLFVLVFSHGYLNGQIKESGVPKSFTHLLEKDVPVGSCFSARLTFI